jgi:thiosulfate dehydrogenase
MTKHARDVVPFALAVVLGAGFASCVPKKDDKNNVGDESTPFANAAASSAFKVPDESTIPTGLLGDAIRRGKLLVTRTQEELPENVGNGLHCTSCHLQEGTQPNAGPWVGVIGMFPEHRARNAKVNTIDERINDCFERSMNGKALPPDGPEMTAIIAYMTWLSRDVPVGREVDGRGFKRIEPAPIPDREHGEEVYATRCASCHGADGGGVSGPDGSYGFPALWGDRSFNIGAGMARLHTAAAFVKWKMPLGQGGTLTDQDAYDVADYFIHQPRPDFSGKEHDWPQGGKPDDARY